jgi:ankyrin repeat protein
MLNRKQLLETRRPLEAARNNDFELLKQLVTLDNVDCFGWNGIDTCLSYAIQHKNVECVLWLIDERKAQVNLQSRFNGWTPLHYATTGFYCNSKFCYILLSRGADIDKIDDSKRTPLYNSIYHYTYSNYNGYSESDSWNCARFLISAGAKISNVHIDQGIKFIPDWVHMLVKEEACKKISILMLGMYKYKLVKTNGKPITFWDNNKDSMLMIAREIWKTRMSDEWDMQRPLKCLLKDNCDSIEKE